MLKFFNSKNPAVRILVIIFSVLIVLNWKDEIIRKNISEHNAYLYEYILVFISGKNFILFYKILTVILLSLNSYFFSNISLYFKLNRKISYIHGFIFLFLISFGLKLTDALPVLFALFFLQVSIKIIMNTLRKQFALFDFFNVGFLIALASFFWFNVIYFVPVIFIGLIILRTINWREWLVPLIGIILSYFLLFSFYYLIHSNFDIIFKFHLVLNQKEELPVLDLESIILFSYLAFVSLIASFIIITRFRTFETNTQDYYRFFFFIFLVTLGIIIFIPGYRFSAVIVIPVSLSIPLSRYFISMKRKLFKEILFDLFLIAVIINVLDVSILNF